MKRIKFFILTLSLIIFTLFTNKVLAIDNPDSLFNFSKVVVQQNITANTNSKQDQIISLSPLTTIEITPGTFKQNVILYAYEGNFDTIKKTITTGQSPISSFYLVFKGPDINPVSPQAPIKIVSYNNYVGTNTYFYSTNTVNKITSATPTEFQGKVKITANLPVSDSGFIVSANKEISKDDPGLHLDQQAKVNPQTGQIETPNKFNNENKTISAILNPNILPYFAVLMIVILGIIFVYLLSRRKSQI